MYVRRSAVWLAAFATLAVAALLSGPSIEAGGPIAALLPLLVTVLWGASWLLARSRAVTLVAAAACISIAVAARLAPAGVVLGLLAYLASGLAIGWGLARSWRADAVLGLALVPVAGLLFMALREAPVERLLAEVERRATVMLTGAGADEISPTGPEATSHPLEGEDGETSETVAADSLAGAAAPDTTAAVTAPDTTAAAGARALAESVAWTLGVMRRLWPALGTLALLAQTGLAVWLVRRTVVWFGAEGRLAPWPPLREWRLPFYLVWTLAAGLALVVVRRGSSPLIGENVICVAATLLAVQGLSVTVDLTGRFLPPWLRVVSGLFAVLVFAPAAAMACALIGLADQWLDFRRGGQPAERG